MLKRSDDDVIISQNYYDIKRKVMMRRELNMNMDDTKYLYFGKRQ